MATKTTATTTSSTSSTPSSTTSTDMALVIREANGLESRVEHALAADCDNYQQLQFLKQKYGKEKVQPATCEGLTRSERILWYRANQPVVQLDSERCSQSSNYRQLQLARGFRAVAESQEERESRARTRSEALVWYRGGGREELEMDSEKLSNCGNWQQYHLMTRGRAEARDHDQEITKSERLLWYRYGGGHAAVEETAELCRDSGNWMQYKLSRDTRRHAEDLTDSMNRHWSDFRSKEELSDHMTFLRNEGIQEREEIRAEVRRRVEKSGCMAKECYEVHRQPFGVEELVEEESYKAAREESAEERIERLRKVTEQMLTSRTEYVVSTRSLALRAMKEDAEEVASSRTVRRTAVVQSGA